MKENWAHTTLGEFVDCNPKISIKKGEIVENCEMEDINIGYKFLYPREGKLYNGSNSKFQNGDTVFARITPCLENGKIAQIKGLKTKAAIGSTEFFVFRGKSKVSDNEFVYYLSQSNLLRDTAVNSMTGASGRQRADLKALKRLEIIIPKDVNHQKRIASILSAYDDLIEVNNKRIELLEQSARELYKEWFVRMRFPNYQQTKFNKGIPKGWEEKSLGEIADFTYGKMPKKELIKEDGYPIFSGYRIVGFYPYFMYSEPTLIVVARGVGGTGDIKITPKECWLTNLSIAILLKDYSQLYYFYYLLSSDNLRALDSGAAQSQITIDSLSKYKVMLADNSLINSFNNKVLPLLSQAEILQKQNQELTEIRNRLLPRLISGKLEVKA